MNPKQAAQVIRDSVTMDQILGLYGYTAGKGGFMRCPFHGEKTASLKIYKGNGGWHCYGCGRGGSVIDFVKEHEGCDFRTAVVAIDRAMHLGLMDPHENPFEASREKRRQHALDNFVNAVYAYADAMIRSIEIQQEIDTKRMMRLEDMRADGRAGEITADEWTRLLEWGENEDCNEYLKERFSEFKEEVAAWRRRLRSPT